METINVDQRSEYWRKLRLGMITASDLPGGSNKKKLAAPGTQVWDSFILKKVSELLTGEAQQIEGKALDWGVENEPKALEQYAFISGKSLDYPGFIKKDARVGFSPDAIFDGVPVEVKCPFNTVYHLANIDGQVKPEYINQCQFAMYVTGASKCVFVSYDPRLLNNPNKKVQDMAIHSIDIPRDEAKMQDFDIVTEAISKDIDTKLAEFGTSFEECKGIKE